MSVEEEKSFVVPLGFSVYAELKRQLEYIHIFMTINRYSCKRRVTLNIKWQSLEIKFAKKQSYTVQFEDVQFVPTTCHGIQWVCDNQLRFRMQIKDVKKINGSGPGTTADLRLNGIKNSCKIKEGKTVSKGTASDDATTPNEHKSLENPEENIISLFRMPNFSCGCKRCGSELLKPTKFERVLALPSDNWYEISDSIFCHKHHPDVADNANNSNANVQSDFAAKCNTLVPNSNDCFVGDTQFILNASALQHSGITNDQHSSGLKCSRCRALVGMSQSEAGIVARKNGLTPAVQSLKVFMHSVKLPWRHKNDASDTVAVDEESWWPSLECEVAQLLVSHCAQYNGYRFVLEARHKNVVQPYLLVWVLETDCEQYVGTTNDDVRVVQSTCTRIVKLMYMDCLREHSKQVTSQWQKDLTVHSIELPTAVCLKVLQNLIQSTRRLPQSQRAVNGFYVGYLRKEDKAVQPQA